MGGNFGGEGAHSPVVWSLGGFCRVARGTCEPHFVSAAIFLLTFCFHNLVLVSVFLFLFRLIFLFCFSVLCFFLC